MQTCVGPEQLAREFGDETRLLADLGWSFGKLLEALEMPAPADLDKYEVTLLSPADLSATLDRLREDALAGSAYYVKPIPDQPENERRERQDAGMLACTQADGQLVFHKSSRSTAAGLGIQPGVAPEGPTRQARNHSALRPGQLPSLPF